MHVSTHIELAKLVITGGCLRPILSLGWTVFHRLNALNHVAVRVYRMSAGDYLALILDAVPSKERDQARVVTTMEANCLGQELWRCRPAALTHAAGDGPARE